MTLSTEEQRTTTNAGEDVYRRAELSCFIQTIATTLSSQDAMHAQQHLQGFWALGDCPKNIGKTHTNGEEF